MSYADEYTEASLKALENRIGSEYQKAYAVMASKADEYFEKFEERWQKEWLAYQSGAYTDAEFKAWEQTQLARGKQWETLRDQMAKKMTKSNEIASAYINDQTPSIYSLNANYQAYEIGQGMDGISFIMQDEQTVKALMMNTENFTEFKTVKTNPVRDYEWNSKQIQSALTSGILQGKGLSQLTDSFMVVMKRNRNSALRNARTAYTSAQNGGRINSLKQAQAQGINVKKKWQAIQDGRARDSHAFLDGQIRPVEKTFSNGLMYPADSSGAPREVYNCRCTLTYVYPDFEKVKDTSKYENQKYAGESFEDFTKRMKSQASYRLKDVEGVNYSQSQKFQDLMTITSAHMKLPLKVRTQLNDVTIEMGNDGSYCDYKNKTILCAQNLTENEYEHEWGHMIEHWMMDKGKVDEYKKYLVEGLNINNIKKEIYYDRAGNEFETFVLDGGRFEDEYQSRLYIEDPLQAINPDGTIDISKLEETISVPFDRYLNGQPISERVRKIIEEAVL